MAGAKVKMLRINMDAPICRANGSPIEGTNLSETIAEIISQVPSDKIVMKLWGWAQRLAGKEVLVIDEPDAKALEEFLQTLRIPIATLAQALQAIQHARDNYGKAAASPAVEEPRNSEVTAEAPAEA